MKLLRTFALALGIALPLWYRQWQFERATIDRVEDFEDQVIKGFASRDEGYEQWGKELLAAITRALKQGARP